MRNISKNSDKSSSEECSKNTSTIPLKISPEIYFLYLFNKKNISGEIFGGIVEVFWEHFSEEFLSELF